MLTKAEKKRKAIAAKKKAKRDWPWGLMRKPRSSWDRKKYRLSITVPLHVLAEARSNRGGISQFFVDLYHYKYGAPRLTKEEKVKIRKKLGDKTKMKPKQKRDPVARAARHKATYVPHGKVGRPRKIKPEDTHDERQGPG